MASGQDRVLSVTVGSCSTAGFHQATGWLVKIENELLKHNLLETVTWKDCLWLQSVTNEAPGIL